MALAEPTCDTVWDHYPDLRAVQAAFNQTIARRRGRVVLIAGGPASGRAGFARALADRLAGHPARPVVVAGSFTPSGGWKSWPPPDPTRLRASAQAGAELAANVLQLSGSLGVPVVGPVGALLGQFAGTSNAVWSLLSHHKDRRQPLDGQDQDDPNVLREVLRAAARAGPVVCVLDHLDRALAAARWWSDLLVRLASELDDLPLLLVATMDGPEVLGDNELGEPTGLWAARRLVNAGVGRWLPIRRLEVDAVAVWLGRCEPEIATRLWEVTGGEPHWLGLLWDAWREDGTVRRDQTGRWVLMPGVAGRAALGIAHDLVRERIQRCYGGLVDDQLDRVVRTLAVGALEGLEFTAQAVAAVADRDPDELIDEFDEHLVISQDHPEGLLEEAGFVELADPRATPGGEGVGRWLCRYRFASELYWRTLRRHGFLSEFERRNGCRALAAALEQALQPEPDRAAAEIASLLREAGDQQAAASWQTRTELGTVLPLVEARAQLLLTQDTSRWDRFDHAQAARQLEHATLLLWEHRPARVVLRLAEGWAQAAQAADWQGEHARALYHCGLLHHRYEEPDAATGCYRQARRAAATAGDLRLAARAMIERAQVEQEQGRVRVARRRAEAARQFAHHQDAPEVEAIALHVLATDAGRAGDNEGALAAARAGVAAAERTGDHGLLATLLAVLSNAQGELGRVGQARATAMRALDMARQAGDRVHEGGIELQLGRLWAGGPPEVAEVHLLRGLAIARQLDHRALRARCHVELARLARRRGEVRGARAELGQATRLARTLGDLGLAAGVWQGWALLAETQDIPGGQIGVLWALAAQHAEQAPSADAASWWEKAERAAAAAGVPGGRAGLAARAQAALAHDGGWGLLEEVFGPFDANGFAASDQAGSGG